MSETDRRPDARDPDVSGGRQDLVHLDSGVELHVIEWTDDSSLDVALAPLLLVHGLASNARLWDGVARRLAAAGHRVVAVDQRGHGRSSKPDDGYDMATVADDLHLLIDALGMRRPVVAGQSWGGNVVLELVYRHPDDVAAIVCIDGGFIDLRQRFPDWTDAARVLAPPRLAGTPLERITGWIESSAADWPDEGRRGTLANFEVFRDGTIAPWLSYDRHMSVLRGMWEHEPTSRYPSITVPVLFIAADSGDVARSHTKRVALDAATAALPDGRAVWFSPAHHDVHAQQPDVIADLLHRFANDPDLIVDDLPEESTA